MQRTVQEARSSVPSTAAVMVAVPRATAVTVPSGDTAATVSSLEVQVTLGASTPDTVAFS